MSDSLVNPHEKARKHHIKLLPVHIEAIHVRSAVRRGAVNILLDVAEKQHPHVTYDEEIIEKIHEARLHPAQEKLEMAITAETITPQKTEQATKEISDDNVLLAQSSGKNDLDIATIRQTIEEARKAA